jgi:phosphoglycolate phosphatase
LRAVLFDFDGTLADCYLGITASVNHVRALHGLPPLSVAEVRPDVGHGPAHLLRTTVPEGDPAANVAAYRAHHLTVMRNGTHLMPGAAEALAALKGRGLRLAVCSNKAVAFTRELLAYLGVASYLDAVLGPEDVARPKPAPDMLTAALQRLRVAPREALYVGDMCVDVETARAAGVTVWVVPTGSDGAEALARARPDHLLHGLAEVPELIERWGTAG